MKLEIDFMQMASLVAVIVGAFWAIGRLLLVQIAKAIDEKFAAVQTGLKSQDESTRRLERDLMELKAELPRDYVRREDYTQAVATIQVKIDHLALRMEAAIRDAYAAATNRERS